MLKELLKNTGLISEIKEFYRKNQDAILDILLFGSAVKGKEKPADIDILVVYKLEKEDLELSYSLNSIFKKRGFAVSITSKTYSSLFDSSFVAREAYLSEAYSLIMDNFISRGLGYDALVLFRYELIGMSKSDRMRFYYSLYGRKKEGGILKKFNARRFSETILSVPVEDSENIRSFLDSWKINYLETPALIPSRILKSKKI
jgi:predicted nucleotidyltransferase